MIRNVPKIPLNVNHGTSRISTFGKCVLLKLPAMDLELSVGEHFILNQFQPTYLRRPRAPGAADRFTRTIEKSINDGSNLFKLAPHSQANTSNG